MTDFVQPRSSTLGGGGAASSASTTPILRTQTLSKTYTDGSVAALVEVSVSIARGEYVAIMGPSGSGKSTLLNLLGALDRPSDGEIYFEEKSLGQLTDKELDAFRSQKLGFVFQSFHLLPTLTALENVQIPMFEGRLSAKQRANKAKELLDSVDMGRRAGHLPAKLSVGERQRVAIARSLANDPLLLLADEPTGNLDSKTGGEILDLFDRLHRQRGMTLVVITHGQEVADRAERIIRLRDGRVVSDGSRRQ